MHWPTLPEAPTIQTFLVCRACQVREAPILQSQRLSAAGRCAGPLGESILVRIVAPARAMAQSAKAFFQAALIATASGDDIGLVDDHFRARTLEKRVQLRICRSADGGAMAKEVGNSRRGRELVRHQDGHRASEDSL